ncbi:MAG: transaminase, acetylornithine/succinylornithine family [Candidatus Hecatellales archaeon B24]|nr:MAG: transaminase, acetylornithine/succinylornithine family [Candidatus Hecatellales archaeon B24]
MSLNREEVIKLENKWIAPVFHRRPVVAVRGRDAILWDANGKQYVDCMAGYGAAFLGHCNPKVVEAVKAQAEKLLACHGSIYAEARAELLKQIERIAPKGLRKIFLSNSGTEAVELAFKAARKYTGKREIIAMMRGFHGKTLGALSATWNPKYRAPFEPLLPGVKFVPYGKAEKVREAVTPDTAAIIVEPVQGEGGIYVAPEGYLEELREICDQHGIILIFDEIQTGFGRTGRLFAYEHWNVLPDILCLAKAAGSGVPIGVTLTPDEVLGGFSIGEHSSTFSGNPLACAAAAATIEVLVEGRLWEKAEALGSLFKGLLSRMAEKYRVVREVRGLGLMLGVEYRFDILDVLNGLLERGVITLSSGTRILRFLPPVSITEAQIEYVVEKLEECTRLLEEGKMKS